MSSIKIEGVDRLVKKLGVLGALESLTAPMQETLYLAQGRMAKYPPAPPNSWYRRTGTLGRRWTTEAPKVEGQTLQGKVGNNTVYGPLVQSRLFQARVHRNRWQTDADVMEQTEPDAIRLFEQRVREIING